MHGSKSVFIFLSADMPVELWEGGVGHVRNNILEVCDTPKVSHLGASKR